MSLVTLSFTIRCQDKRLRRLWYELEVREHINECLMQAGCMVRSWPPENLPKNGIIRVVIFASEEAVIATRELICSDPSINHRNAAKFIQFVPENNRWCVLL